MILTLKVPTGWDHPSSAIFLHRSSLNCAHVLLRKSQFLGIGNSTTPVVWLSRIPLLILCKINRTAPNRLCPPRLRSCQATRHRRKRRVHGISMGRREYIVRRWGSGGRGICHSGSFRRSRVDLSSMECKFNWVGGSSLLERRGCIDKNKKAIKLRQARCGAVGRDNGDVHHWFLIFYTCSLVHILPALHSFAAY